MGPSGDLFEIVIGTLRLPIVVIIGITSSVYTAYGGLYVSIITDQAAATPLLAAPLTGPCCAVQHCAERPPETISSCSFAPLLRLQLKHQD